MVISEQFSPVQVTCKTEAPSASRSDEKLPDQVVDQRPARPGPRPVLVWPTSARRSAEALDVRWARVDFSYDYCAHAWRTRSLRRSVGPAVNSMISPVAVRSNTANASSPCMTCARHAKRVSPMVRR
jgi:hypothetical protein